MFAESLAIDVVSRRTVVGDALEALRSSEIVVLTMEFNGDDLS
jgi:hypothetical protein